MRRSLLGATALASLLFATESMGFVLSNSDWAWQASPVSEPFEFNLESFPALFGGATDAEIEGAYLAAMNRWTFDAGADVAFVYGGLTANTSWSNDGQNIASYDALAAGGTLAFAQTWISSGDIIDCDIELYGTNAFGAMPWSVDPGGAVPGEYDFELTVIHELGHCLGLGHSLDSDAVMYGVQNSGTGEAERELDADDQAGVQAIYGLGGSADLVLGGFAVVDLGDGDGLIEPGETFEIVYYAENLANADAIDVITTTSEADADILVDSALGAPLLGPDIAALSSDDIEGTVFEVDAGCTASKTVPFTVTVEADNFVAEDFVFDVPLTCDGLAVETSDWILGQLAWVEVTGASPGESVKILRGTGGEGPGACPVPLGGLCLDLLAPVVVQQTVVADAAGVARWDFTVPATAPANTDLWVQAVAVRGVGGVDSVKSDVEPRTILP